MIRRPPRSTLDRSSAASDVYKRQVDMGKHHRPGQRRIGGAPPQFAVDEVAETAETQPVSYTHLRAHETVLDLVCRLLLEKKKTKIQNTLTRS